MSGSTNIRHHRHHKVHRVSPRPVTSDDTDALQTQNILLEDFVSKHTGRILQKRFYAAAIDLAILTASALILGIVLVGAATILNIYKNNKIELVSTWIALSVIPISLYMLIIMEGRTGITPGKYLLHLRTVNEDGNPPGFWRITIFISR